LSIGSLCSHRGTSRKIIIYRSEGIPARTSKPGSNTGHKKKSKRKEPPHEITEDRSHSKRDDPERRSGSRELKEGGGFENEKKLVRIDPKPHDAANASRERLRKKGETMDCTELPS